MPIIMAMLTKRLNVFFTIVSDVLVNMVGMKRSGITTRFTVSLDMFSGTPRVTVFGQFTLF